MLIGIIIVLLSSTNIVAQEITMFPGFWSMKYFQDSEHINKPQFESLLNNIKEANMLWQKSKRNMTIGWIAFGSFIGFDLLQWTMPPPFC